MHTRLTDLLDIEHPVMLAGMGGVSYHRLVAAVSEAGGIGTFGASTMGAGELATEIAEVKKLTAKPFGVDLLTALPGQVEQGIRDVIEGGARIFVAGLGVPREVIDALHAKNILVGSMCGKVRHAIAAAASGCDFVVAQGTEAGGHTGFVATMALVPQVVDAVGESMPVVAAGGLFDGRGLAAALSLGADGVWIGTRFIATPEARAVRGYKDQLLAIGEDGTVDLQGLHRQDLPGGAQRVDEPLREPPRRAQAVSRAGLHLGPGQRQSPRLPRRLRGGRRREFMPCGQGVGAIDSLVPAGDIVRSMVAEAEAVIDRIASLRR